MDLEAELDDTEILAINAPVFCPSCNTPLAESGDTGNRVCAQGFPPCCYLYWNRKEKKSYWKEGFGPDHVYNHDEKKWRKKEPTEKEEVSA